MKILIISDIHGNIYALKSMLEFLKNKQIDSTLVAGDILGYYPFSNETINILKSIKNCHIVLGNHDKFFIDSLKNRLLINDYRKKYGDSILEFHENISNENLAFIMEKNLFKIIKINALSIYLMHGSPNNLLEGYIYPNTFYNYNDINHNLIIHGHTHYRMVRKYEDKIVINPGSLGQPRDGKPPSFVIFDSITKRHDFYNVNFDKKKLFEDLKERKYPDFLFNIQMRWDIEKA